MARRLARGSRLCGQASDQNQQFKDGVLWADCRGLLKTGDVCLVTADKAFYRDRKYELGLARNLADEISGEGHSFKLFSSLEELLGEIKTGIAIDRARLLEVYLQQEQSRLDQMLAGNGFALGTLLQVQPELYITEKPTVLYLQFSAEFNCEDISSENRYGRLTLKGRGIYNSESKTFSDLQSSGERSAFALPRATKSAGMSSSLSEVRS